MLDGGASSSSVFFHHRVVVVYLSSLKDFDDLVCLIVVQLNAACYPSSLSPASRLCFPIVTI